MKKKGKSEGMNKKVLHRMTEHAMPESPRPNLSLYGKDAEALFGKRPGTKVKMQVSGVVTSVGVQEWQNDQPTASIRITKIEAGNGEKAKE